MESFAICIRASRVGASQPRLGVGRMGRIAKLLGHPPVVNSGARVTKAIKFTGLLNLEAHPEERMYLSHSALVQQVLQNSHDLLILKPPTHNLQPNGHIVKYFGVI
jgi:hypothetical protein